MAQGAQTADVVVVGGGGAGLAAAIAAAEAGALVVVLEKNAALGGSTAWSVGSLSATGTPHQIARGIHDTPDDHFDDLEILAGRYANRDNRVLRRILVDGTRDLMAWLDRLGLVFVGPNVEPPHRRPRMHNVVPNSRAFPAALGRECRRLGVDIRLGTQAESLVVEAGAARGVRIRGPDGKRSELRARRGVVLAGGDYSASAAMKREFASDAVAECEPVNPTATGDGIRLGLDAGGVMVNGDIVRGPIMRFVPPTRPNPLLRLPPSRLLGLAMRWAFDTLPARVLRPLAMRFLTTALGPSPELFAKGAILVNREGCRFADERAGAGPLVPAQPGREAFILLDGAVATQFSAWPHFVSTAPGIAYAYLDDYRRTRRDIFHEASTLGGLAAAMGIDPTALEATVARYNEAERFTSAGERPPLAAPPFVALGPIKSYVVFTDGGLKVDETLRVLDGDDRAIPGLWAAGSNGQGGLLLEGHGHHLGWAFISGRLAGAAAAAARPGTRQADDRVLEAAGA